MSKYRKVVWNEGMLLTPHHFQQADNYQEELLNSRVRSIMQHEYGVMELRVSSEAIANGNFQVTTCRAVSRRSRDTMLAMCGLAVRIVRSNSCWSSATSASVSNMTPW